jgi:integrase-like protein
MSKVLEETRTRIRLKHYSLRTEQYYLHWIKEYVLFHKKRHPLETGKISYRLWERVLTSTIFRKWTS